MGEQRVSEELLSRIVGRFQTSYQYLGLALKNRTSSDNSVILPVESYQVTNCKSHFREKTTPVLVTKKSIENFPIF